MAKGLGVARIVIDAASPPPSQIGTYPRPSLDTPSARQALDGLVARFMGEVVAYWTADPLDADFGMAMANLTTAADGADIDADTSDEDDWSVFDLPGMFQPWEGSGWRHGDTGARGRPC